jgi:hypothetical protein
MILEGVPMNVIEEEKGTKFPNLPFIFRAEGFLIRCRGLKIKEQLHDRQIEEIHAIPHEEEGLVVCGLKTFYLNLNIQHPLREQAESMGKAIAETFLYNFTYPLSCQQIGDFERHISKRYIPDFAVRWVEVNTLDKIVDYLQFNIH